MAKTFTAALTAAATAFIFSPVGAQPTDGSDSFVRKPREAQTASDMPPCPIGSGAWLPVRCWEGKQFIFLPLSQSRQKMGYLEYGSGPTYSEAVGKTATVTTVKLNNNELGLGQEWTVVLKMDDGGRTFATTALLSDKSDLDSGRVQGIALLSDLQAARQTLKGQEVWVMRPSLHAPDDDSIRPQKIAYKHYSKARISDILAGANELTPIRIAVEFPDGTEGVVDVAAEGTGASGTNATKPGKHFVYSTFSRFFSKTDPHEANPWTPKMWDAIQNELVFEGMNEQQVLYSLVGPADPSFPTVGGLVQEDNKTIINGRVHEQWVMDSSTGFKYLYFDNGVLTAVQK